jgi:hypothetical protein
MCWNKEVSLVTFLVVIIIVIILYTRNVGSDRHLAIFSAIVVTVQLLEFFVWLSIENGDKNMNSLVTRLILIVLWLQPLINTIMAYNDVNREDCKDDGDRINNKWKKAILVICFIVFGALAINGIVNSTKGKFSSRPGPGCHLIWKRKVKGVKTERLTGNKYMVLIYLIGLTLPLLLMKPFLKAFSLVVLGLILLVISKLISSPKESSSWWCWIAFVFVIAAYFYCAPFDNKKKEQESDNQTESEKNDNFSF